jgi:hypothetical protein
MVTNNQLLAVDKILGKYAKLPSVQWRYCVARNLLIIKPFIEAYQKALPITDNLRAFEQKKASIIRSPKTDEEKKTEMDELLVQYPDINKDYEDYLSAEKELLVKEIDISFYKLEAKNLPGWNEQGSCSEDPDDTKTIAIQDMVALIELGIVCDSFALAAAKE